MKNAINWFEIPVSDFDRAKKFYEAVFETEMAEMMMGPYRMGFLPYDQNDGVGGAIVQGPECEAVGKGIVVYINPGGTIESILGKVEQAGGNTIMPKTEISPEVGFMGMFIDTEGNRIGVHEGPAA